MRGKLRNNSKHLSVCVTATLTQISRLQSHLKAGVAKVLHTERLKLRPPPTPDPLPLAGGRQLMSVPGALAAPVL